MVRFGRASPTSQSLEMSAGMDASLIDARIRECTAAGFWRNEHLDAYLDRWATTRPD